MKRDGLLNRKKTKKISHIILGIVMPVFLAFLLLLFIIDIFAVHMDKTNNMMSIQQYLSSISKSVELHVNSLNQYMYTIYQDNEDYGALTKVMDYGETFSHAADLNAVLNRYMGINKEVDSYFIVYGKNKDIIGALYSDVIPKEHQDILTKQAKSLIGSSKDFYEYVVEIDEKAYYVSVYKSGQICVVFITDLMKFVIDIEQSIHYGGTGYLLFPEASFADKYADVAEIFLSLKDCKEYVHYEKQGKSVFFGHKISETNLWFIYQTDNIQLHRFSFMTIILMIMTGAFVLSMIVMLFITRKKIAQPMYALVDLMREIKYVDDIPDNNLQLPYYEMQLMNKTLVDMVMELRLSKESFYEEKINRQTAELKFLQAQLKPHFYLNCLKMLNAKAHDAGLTEMQDMILMISDYLRYCLGSVKNVISLKEELELTKRYVELQKILSGRDIEYEFVVDDGVLFQNVPMFCIQSFVENSIKYAQDMQKLSQLKIQVIVTELVMENEIKLDIMVKDSGQGYDLSKLAQYNRKWTYDSDGVGINNIKRRCDVLYGERADYMFYNMDGAVSELILPMEKVEE